MYTMTLSRQVAVAWANELDTAKSKVSRKLSTALRRQAERTDDGGYVIMQVVATDDHLVDFENR